MAITRQFPRSTGAIPLANDWEGRLQQRKDGIPDFDVLPTLEIVRKLIGLLNVRMPGIQHLFENQQLFEVSIRPPEMLTLILRAQPVPSREHQMLLASSRYISVGLYSVRSGEIRPIDEIVMAAKNGYPILYRDRQGLEWPVVRAIGKLLYDTVANNKAEVYREATELARKINENYTWEAANGQGINGASILYWINHQGGKR